MNKKTVVAIDIDDVLAQTTEALRLFVNEKEGLNLATEDYRVPATYWGYYEHVWTQAGITNNSHLHEFHKRMGINQSAIVPVEGSQKGVRLLSTSFDLLAVSSRESFMKTETIKWLKQYFGEVFIGLELVGHASVAQKSKGDICKNAGALWLIDDNQDHCMSAIERGVDAVLYGDYGWNKGEAPAGIARAKDWQQIEEFFHGRT